MRLGLALVAAGPVATGDPPRAQPGTLLHGCAVRGRGWCRAPDRARGPLRPIAPPAGAASWSRRALIEVISSLARGRTRRQGGSLGSPWCFGVLPLAVPPLASGVATLVVHGSGAMAGRRGREWQGMPRTRRPGVARWGVRGRAGGRGPVASSHAPGTRHERAPAGGVAGSPVATGPAATSAGEPRTALPRPGATPRRRTR